MTSIAYAYAISSKTQKLSVQPNTYTQQMDNKSICVREGM
jgi:hypothetical protein